MYKSKLQELCQQRRWALPRYTSMKDGPDHDPSFKASVFLDGTSFHSSPSCKSLKEAQNDAAKSAFLHFTSSSSSCPAAAPHPAPKIEVGLYKNLLQELTQKERLSIPEYKTMKCGQAHSPTFFSSVEVEGEVFHGKGGKSKKEAELNAAKVAYTSLTERLLGKCPGEQSPGEPLKSEESEEHYGERKNDDVLEGKTGEEVLAKATASLLDNPSSFSDSVPAALKEGLKDGSSKLYLSDHDFAASVENEETAEKEKVVAKATTSPHSSSSCPEYELVSPGKGSSSSTLAHLDISAVSISDSNTKKDPGLKSYLLNNRFRVYPCFPEIAFPKGITVLPISEDKWVAVSLEFPNEKDD